MKKIVAALVGALLSLSLTACQTREVAHVTETTLPAATQAVIETFQAAAEPVPEFSFSQLEYHTFYFSSGAGGWFTEMTIGPDGSFSGHFQDFNAENGDGYQGVLFSSDFTGKFSQPVYVNDSTCALRLETLQDNRHRPDEILDGMLIDYGDPYGISGGEEFLLYLPGAPLAELPEEYRSWVGYYDLSMTQDTVLPFYGLYNVTQECGFSSYDIIENVRDAVAAAEQQDAALHKQIYEDPNASQADMNMAAASRYEVWDSVLNHLWGVLKKTMDEESMKTLTSEELAWIAEKEAAVLEAGKDVEGGSLYPLVTGAKAAQLTRERVYALLAYLP